MRLVNTVVDIIRKKLNEKFNLILSRKMIVLVITAIVLLCISFFITLSQPSTSMITTPAPQIPDLF